MIYLWKTPGKFYESIIGDDVSRYIGIYNKEKGPNRFLLDCGKDEGKLWSFSKEELVFNFKTKRSELITTDVLANGGDFIIVNARVKKILDQFASKDIQFLQATVICVDGELDNYSVVNILSRVSGINRAKSKCEFVTIAPNSIVGFAHGVGTLVYNHNCLGIHHIAREKEYDSFVLISQELKDALRELDPPIKEVSFILPEEMEW